MTSNTLSKLQEVGWNIKEEYLQNLSYETLNFHSSVKLLLDSDLKEAGTPSLPSDFGKGKSIQINTPIILQVTNVRNVSAPKANEESGTAPRMLRLTLTDGTNYVHGLEISLIKSLSLKTAPGTKIKLISRVPVLENYLLLNPSNTEVVGGVVDELFQKWKLSESVSKYSRLAVIANDGSGPPPWVPFGKKILAEKERNFKAMGDTSVKKKENDEFEVQRQQVVQELTKDGTQKVFGGGKQMLDSNVQKIINSGGFTIEEAEWALKRNKNDLKKALQDLKRGQNGMEEMDGRTTYPTYEERGKTRGAKRGRRGKGKDNKGPDGSDDEIPHTVMARPSGPASLLDYLESRITEKGGDAEVAKIWTEEKHEYRHPPRGRDQRGGRRGRGRGRGDYNKHLTNNVQKNEPLSVESWPSLGEQPKSNSTIAQPVVDRNASHSSNSSQSVSHSQHNYSQNERSTHYAYKDDHQNYRNSHSNYRSNTSSNNFREQSSYQQNSYKDGNQHQFYRNESQSFDDSQRGRRAEQPYYRRGMGRDLHNTTTTTRGQSKNYTYANNTSQPYHNQEDGYYRSEGGANYGGSASYGAGGGSSNYGGGSGSSYVGGGSSENYGGKGNGANYGGGGSSANYGGGSGANYSGGGGSTMYGGGGGSTNYSGGRGGANYSGGGGGSANYSGGGGANYSGGGGANYGGGGGANYGGGGNATYSGGKNYGEGSKNYSEGGSKNYSEGGSKNYGGGGSNGGKVHTAKEKELIAQFEKSMVMAGCYEDSSYNQQNRAYSQGYRQGYYDNNSSQEFSGSFEFHRGGGYSRRSQGGRRGRY